MPKHTPPGAPKKARWSAEKKSAATKKPHRGQAGKPAGSFSGPHTSRPASSGSSHVGGREWRAPRDENRSSDRRDDRGGYQRRDDRGDRGFQRRDDRAPVSFDDAEAERMDADTWTKSTRADVSEGPVDVAADNGFAALGLPERLVERLAREGITS